jgi:hypothetical protein
MWQPTTLASEGPAPAPPQGGASEEAPFTQLPPYKDSFSPSGEKPARGYGPFVPPLKQGDFWPWSVKELTLA